MRLLRAALVLAALAGCDRAGEAAPAAVKPEPSAALTVDGTAFVLTLADGTRLSGTQLAGATVHAALGEGAATTPVKLVSIAPDPEDPTILRHDFQVPDGQGGWKAACGANAYGERWGFPVLLPEGHPGREGEVTLTCTNGAVAKCVRWGYKPWSRARDGSALAPLHAACVRMARADYCGDGVTHTKEATAIDVVDDFGIQSYGSVGVEDYVFEAGWTAEGAVCVAHVRWKDLATLEQLRTQCPRLAMMPVCNEAAARAAGAHLFNKSRLQ